jgi:CubicO group peptidase (beta-lactamase class C family)
VHLRERVAQLLLVAESFRPKGYARESFAGKKAHLLAPERVLQPTSFIETAITKLRIPRGVAFSLVNGDKVVFEGGFGVRELGKPAPVDADPMESAKLAARYYNHALGDMAVRKSGVNLIFDFGGWASAVASRRTRTGLSRSA